MSSAQVKALEWHQGTFPRVRYADTLLGRYKVVEALKTGGGEVLPACWIDPKGEHHEVASPESGIAAAQAHFNASIISALEPGEATTEATSLPEDLFTHQAAWRRGLALLRDTADYNPPDVDDKSYWQHELDVFDRAFAALASPITPPSPAVTDAPELDGPTEQEIDRLRLKAFQTNNEEDNAAYFNAASKWFQDRHYRRLANPVPTPDGAVTDAMVERSCIAFAGLVNSSQADSGIQGYIALTEPMRAALSASISPEERAADVLLRAAATDMLAALKGLTDYSRKPTQADWQAADDAIAKAENVTAALSAAAATNPDQLANKRKVLSKTGKDFSGAPEQIMAEVAPTPATATDAETLKARAASVLCEAGALCGWPAPNCNAREGAEALFKAGLLSDNSGETTPHREAIKP